ncbi:MAG: hypothetical protein COU72_04070 [Parcubacteria group bacterium CG10_big_fil_rev_8_21_14_0_10_41_35]|nr:MAG: hypothetical protein COU72_04070 [Parcubacteria group bacterium CG10_big_fil_rev_8_21_14_0_10_41_35]
MQVNTLIIGHVPLLETTGIKPKEVRDDEYFKELISQFDLGTLHYTNWKDWKTVSDEIDPLVIIYFGGEYQAEEVKRDKNDALIYVADDAGSVFRRKAECEEKKERNVRILTEVESIVQKIRNDGEREVEAVRKFSAMSYNDMYKMIKEAIIGDNEELRTKAWGLLMDNDGHKNFVWMRVQLMAEVWEHADGKNREKLMCMSMERHTDQGTARKIDNFTDEEGLEYHQYMFLDPLGNDTNYIRRLPFGKKGQDKYAYENLLEKNEIPTNYLRVQVEANSLREQWDNYLVSEGAKVQRVLEEWKNDPSKSKKDLGVVPWSESDDVDEPLTERELGSLKKFLKKHSLNASSELFKEDKKM